MPKLKRQSADQRRKFRKEIQKKTRNEKSLMMNRPLDTIEPSIPSLDNINVELADITEESNNVCIDPNISESSCTRMKKLREKESYRESERCTNKERIKTIRAMNELYKKEEHVKNQLRIKSLRKNEEVFKEKENILNRERIRNLRENDEMYKNKEASLNQLRMKTIRQNDEYKMKELSNNNEYQKRIRSSETYREIEKLNENKRKKLKRENDKLQEFNSFEEIEDLPLNVKFFDEIREGPTELCLCCDRLWFLRQTENITKKFVIEKHNENLWNAIFDITQETARVCSSCRENIYKGKIPKYWKGNYDIVFPVSKVLNNLTILEERLVSPRLPFMQIRRLGYDKQCSIKGQIVNVPISLDTTVNALPRNINDTCTIQLKLKKRLHFDKDYICETVRPGRVIAAAEYLIEQPLYKELNLKMSSDWQTDDQSKVQVETVDVVDDEIIEFKNMEKELDEIINEFEKEDIFRLINPGGEETLLDNENMENIALAPGENRTPLHLMQDPYAEELSFPTIFCGRKKELKVKFSYSDIVKLQTMHKDRRFSRTDFLLYMYKKEILIHVVSNINVAIRQKITGVTNLTAGYVKNKENVDKLIQFDSGYNFLKKIPASPAHWQSEKRKVMSMIRQFNIPTIFLTLSAAETMWPELICILSKLIDKKEISEKEAMDMSHNEKARLIRTDPITCARYFNNRFRILFRHMKSLDGPFSEHPIEYYYYRVEFQNRGSPHIHSLLWLKNAPICDFSNPETVERCEQFIQKYITCDSSLKNVSHLIPYQTHNHSKSCKREFKNVVSCRYGFPFLPMDKVTILIPREEKNKDEKEKTLKMFVKIKSFLSENVKNGIDMNFSQFLEKFSLTRESYLSMIRTNLKKPTVFLERKVSDCFVNPFNEEIFGLMKSNMDIQYILDPYACCVYIINYINKSERGVSQLLKAAMEEIKHGNLDLKRQLNTLGNVFMNASEVSAQEAAYSVLKLHMSESRNSEIFISTRPPEERVRMLKTQYELASMNPDDCDIFKSNLFDHYVQRPDDLEEICLAEFAAYYTFKHCDSETELKKNQIRLKDGSGILIKRRKPHVLSFNKYGLQQDPINFYRSQLMLYTSWRDEYKELIQVNQEQIYMACIDRIEENRLKFDLIDTEKLDDVLLEAKKNVEDILHSDEPNKEEFDPEYMPYGLDDPEIDVLADLDKKPEVSKGFPTPYQVSDEEFFNIISTLNSRQYEYLDHILNKIIQKESLYEIISGGAGTGKSHLIKAMSQSIIRHFNSIPGNDPTSIKVLLSSATGKAAFNINGLTLHSVFILPVNQYSGNLVPLSHDTVKKLYTRLADLKLIIIDEFSMVGSKMFNYINLRLQQIFKSKEDFAGIPMILVGDLCQLPPVGDRWIFASSYDNPYAEICGNYLWEKFRYYRLEEIMRQRDDKKFAFALNNMAIGEMTNEDVALFKTRIVSLNQIIPENTIHLFSTNNEVDAYNEQRLNEFTTERCVSKATDCVKGSCSEKKKKQLLVQAKGLKKAESFGLMVSLILQVNAKYMLSVNIDVEDGLVNGATGILRKIERNSNQAPTKVWMEFTEERVGKLARKKYNILMLIDEIPLTWTPVMQIARAINVTKGSNVMVERKQFPLMIAEAITIHKSQGSTYNNIGVHLKPDYLESHRNQNTQGYR